jgi:hypothetical protein
VCANGLGAVAIGSEEHAAVRIGEAQVVGDRLERFMDSNCVAVEGVAGLHGKRERAEQEAIDSDGKIGASLAGGERGELRGLKAGVEDGGVDAVERSARIELSGEMDFAEGFAVAVMDRCECLECRAIVEAGAPGGGVDFFFGSLVWERGP